jgi:U3 small nucleolar RNA-associated protein 13
MCADSIEYGIWLTIVSGSKRHGRSLLCTHQEVLQSLRTANALLHVLQRISCSQMLAMALKFAVLLVCVPFQIFGLLCSSEHLQQDSQPIHSLCMSPSASHLIVFTSSLSLRIYELPNTRTPLGRRVQPIRVVGRAHDAPVHICVVDPTSTYLASGSADGVVKVWNILGGFVTHVFKGHGGVVSALLFSYPQDRSTVVRNEMMHLISASVDTRIRIFNLTEGSSTSSGGGKPEAVLEGHVSVPRGLDVSLDGRWLISGGRDSVVLIWDLHSKVSPAPPKAKKKNVSKQVLTPKLVSTIPVLERVEAVGILHSLDGEEESKLETLKFYTGGEKGVVKVWNAKSANVTQQIGKEHQGTSSEDLEEQRQITNIL